VQWGFLYEAQQLADTLHQDFLFSSLSFIKSEVPFPNISLNFLRAKRDRIMSRAAMKLLMGSGSPRSSGSAAKKSCVGSYARGGSVPKSTTARGVRPSRKRNFPGGGLVSPKEAKRQFKDWWNESKDSKNAKKYFKEFWNTSPSQNEDANQEQRGQASRSRSRSRSRSPSTDPENYIGNKIKLNHLYKSDAVPERGSFLDDALTRYRKRQNNAPSTIVRFSPKEQKDFKNWVKNDDTQTAFRNNRRAIYRTSHGGSRAATIHSYNIENNKGKANYWNKKGFSIPLGPATVNRNNQGPLATYHNAKEHKEYLLPNHLEPIQGDSKKYKSSQQEGRDSLGLRTMVDSWATDTDSD
jgi:hypothetical protein